MNRTSYCTKKKRTHMEENNKETQVVEDKSLFQEQGVVQEEVNPEVKTSETPIEKKPIQEEDPAERNFLEIRKKAHQAQKERDELKRYVEELQKQQATPKPTPEPEPQLAADDLVEWGVVDKKIKALEQKIEEQQKYARQTTVESQLRSRYNDFDAVVNKENVESLRETYPELATSLASNPDLYSQSVAVYTTIKKLGIQVEDTYSDDRESAQKNANKPRPLASVGSQQGESPISKANAFAQGLTPELKKQLWKEMNEYANKG